MKTILPLILGFFLLLVPSVLADSPISIYVSDNLGPVGGASVAVIVNGAGVTGTTGPDASSLCSARW